MSGTVALDRQVSSLTGRERRKRRITTSASLFVGFGLVALGGVFYATFPIYNRAGLVQVEQILVVVYTSVRAASAIRPTSPRIVALIMWLWVYTLFGLVQIVQLSKEDNPFHVAAPDSVVSRQLAVVLVGLLAADVVSVLAHRGTPKPPGERRILSLRRTIALSWITVLASPILAAKLGGSGALFSSRLAVGQALGLFTPSPSTTTVILYEFSNVAPFFCAFSLIRLRQAKQFTFLARPSLIVLFALLTLCNVLFNNPISQPRFWIATIAVSIALSGKWLRRVQFQVALVGVYVVIALIAFPYLDLTRASNVNQAAASAPSASLTETYLDKTDYGTMQDVSNAITYVDNHGFTRGRQVSGAILFFVPRSLWPGKPYDTARLLATDIGFYQNLNLDSPLWAEGYIDAGFIGVVVVLGAFGFFVGRADRLYVGGASPLSLTSILIPALAGYELILLRGSLLQATGRLALMLALGWAISTRGSDRERDASVTPVSEPH